MMLSKFNSLRGLLSAEKMTVVLTQSSGLKSFPPPKEFKDVELPEKGRLRPMEKVPQYPPTLRPFKMQKRLRYMRGPEPVHTELLHKQYGIVATGGGRLRHENFEMIRMFFLRHLELDSGKVFAMWRVDPPWQPVTKKGQGQRMGGGKGHINHYVTPIKAGRVIVEVGGHVEYFEVEYTLRNVAARLPFKAEAVSYEGMLEKRRKEEELERTNCNPWTWKYVIQNNMGGCHRWISKYDMRFLGKYL
ncbi:39S ribosomal protein L16, mitochondrial [Diachasma alloeum]|uniref:39S ribosomal protein L16, mitochondrial n=1 Tax=Diachasma alloeum TaxID=454923 RepID=UPI00073828B7|nr:39S ribosomal protein L16, mitochondrial [Diachasma alloeum]